MDSKRCLENISAPFFTAADFDIISEMKRQIEASFRYLVNVAVVFKNLSGEHFQARKGIVGSINTLQLLLREKFMGAPVLATYGCTSRDQTGCCYSLQSGRDIDHDL